MSSLGAVVGAVLGAVLGLMLAAGVLVVVSAWTRPRAVRRERSGWQRGMRSGRSRVVVLCVGAALAGGAVTLAITSVPMVAMVAAVGCGLIPVIVVKRRRRRMREAQRAAWPEAVDTLVSAVRAGLSLPEGLADLSRRGPAVLRSAFSSFEDDLHSRGTLSSALDRLQERLADPVAAQVIAVVRLADEVGGSSLGSVLRALSASLRQDASVRAEIAARQSWTIVSARVAVAAPWLTLALLCTRPESAAAYRSLSGAVIVTITAALSLVAYLLMLRIARLPQAASA